MNSKRLIVLALAAFGSISLASCGGGDKPVDPVSDKATITVVDGTGSGQYTIGDTATIKANDKIGKKFVEWQVDNKLRSNLNPYTFTVTKDERYVAIYDSIKVNITVNGGTGSGVYNFGDTVSISPTLEEGKEFVSWLANGETLSEVANYTFTADKDMVITANVKNKDPEKVVVNVTGGTGAGSYNVGELVTVVATVPKGKQFKNWTVNGAAVSTSASYTFTASVDVTLVANFEDLPEHKMAQYTKTVTMNGDEFKILNLTDIQLHDGDDFEVNKHIIDQVVERTQPDLITVLGDTLNDDTTYTTVEMPKKIVNLIDSYNVPWAPIFGNHDNITYKPEGSKKYGGVEYLEELFAESNNCLYVRGPEEIQGSSNYIVNVVKEGTNKLVESLIFLDSYHVGLDATNTAFYVDAVNYVKELNDNVTPRSIVFEHVPIPQYGTLFTAAENEELHNISGVPFRDPITGTDASLFPKIKELGSTKAVISGHDHEIAFVADYEGVNLVYALKSSIGDDPGGNAYSHLLGGMLLTLDGENEEKFDYEKVVDLPYEIVSGSDFPYFPEVLQYWRYSGAKLVFDIELPESGTIKFNLEGTNFRRDESEKLQKGSWNRLTENVVVDASTKTVNYGSLTPINDDKYRYELDLTEIPLNLAGGEKAYGDETARLVYFNNPTNNFKVNDIHFEMEDVPVTDQIDLSKAEISPIPDQSYLKGRVIRPEVTVTLNGSPLTLVDEILVKYSNEKEIGVATVEVVPSGKGAYKYKGSKTTTFNIVGNPWRGDAFEAGFTRNFDDTPLTETIQFDVHFTSANNSTMWFMIGDGWDDYFGYYGLNANGTLADNNYSGVSVAPTSDEYVRVTCVLSLMNKTNGSNPNPTEKVNLFYVHGSWGSNPTGYIDFDLGDAPETVRGEAFASGEDKSINFEKLGYDATVVVDFKFTSNPGTHLNFFIGNKENDWKYYFGYYKLTEAGAIEGDSNGITVSTTSDGYYRLTIVLSELTKASADGGPSSVDGFNLFYIRGGWTTGSGYVDFNPVV